MANQTSNQFRAVGFIDKSKRKTLGLIALNDDTSIKGMVEAYLNKLAETGKPYLDLYTEHQRTLQLLQELTKETI